MNGQQHVSSGEGRTFDVLVEHDEDVDLYVAEVLDLPDVYSQGATLEEALGNIAEAVRLHLADQAEAPHFSHRQVHRIVIPA